MAQSPLHVGADGWIAEIQHLASPNCDARPADASIELLVVHNISLPPGQFGSGAIERLFCNALDADADPFFATVVDARVSAHFLISRDGCITQFVSCDQRAWHAGTSIFDGRPRCNDFSVGIELEGTDFLAFTSPQYDALAQLTMALRTALPLRAVRGHSHIAPDRKTDPGPLFDWRRFARQADLPLSWLPLADVAS